MTAHAVLTDPTLKLPKERQIDDFEAFVRGILDGFLSTIGHMAGADELAASIKTQVSKMTTLCDNLKSVMGMYLAGNTYKAYQRFVDSLAPIMSDLEMLMTRPDGVSDVPVMYRMRVTGQQQIFSEDIFHIPFQERHKATMKRYSVPGVPMLYIGGSVYICWEEMGRPSFDQIQISAFHVKSDKPLKLLNFGYTPSWCASHLAPPDATDKDGNAISRLLDPSGNTQKQICEYLTSYLTCWPLIALCSIKAKYLCQPFVPEYVIPQMVLQWLMGSKGTFDGIRYFSTHVDRDFANPHLKCNFVFPPKQFPPRGQCPDLRGNFEMSDPLPWRILESVPLDIMRLGSRPTCYDFSIYPGATDDYGATTFGEVETVLNEIVRNHPSSWQIS
jgi:hypothetical protein